VRSCWCHQNWSKPTKVTISSAQYCCKKGELKSLPPPPHLPPAQFSLREKVVLLSMIPRHLWVYYLWVTEKFLKKVTKLSFESEASHPSLSPGVAPVWKLKSLNLGLSLLLISSILMKGKRGAKEYWITSRQICFRKKKVIVIIPFPMKKQCSALNCKKESSHKCGSCNSLLWLCKSCAFKSTKTYLLILLWGEGAYYCSRECDAKISLSKLFLQ